MKEPTNRGGLTGIKEIADAIGVSKQRADQIADGDNFPAPFDDLGRGRGRIWMTADVRELLEQLRAERDQRMAA